MSKLSIIQEVGEIQGITEEQEVALQELAEEVYA